MTTLSSVPGAYTPESSPESAAQRPQSPDAAPSLLPQVRELLARVGVGGGMLAFVVLAEIALVLCVLLLFAAFEARAAEALRWGRRLVDVQVGGAAIALAAVAAAGLAGALRATARSSRAGTLAGIGVALACGLGFIALQVNEYIGNARYGLAPGTAYKPNERYVAWQFGVKLPKRKPHAPAMLPVNPDAVAFKPDATKGRDLFLRTCATCHGPSGEGLPGYGKDLRVSEFVHGLDDDKLVAFIIAGRQPWDPLNTTKVQMPPRGGNPMLKDNDLRHIVAFVRELQKSAPAAAVAATGQTGAAAQPTAAPQSGDAAAPAAAGAQAAAPDAMAAAQLLLLTHQSTIPPPAPAPGGVQPELIAEAVTPVWKPPQEGASFFGLYYFTTSVQLAYVVVATGLTLALLALALRGRLNAANRAPLAVGAAAWAGIAAVAAVLLPVVYGFGG